MSARSNRKCFYTLRTDYHTLTGADVTVLLVQRLSCCGFPASVPPTPPPTASEAVEIAPRVVLQAARGLGSISFRRWTMSWRARRRAGGRCCGRGEVGQRGESLLGSALEAVCSF